MLAGLVLYVAGCTLAEPACESSPGEVEVAACPAVYVGTGDPYVPGALALRRIEVAQCQDGAPRPMLVFAPEAPGAYAVVVFQHGFVLRNALYSQVLQHVASHGFVVVAPQMYEPGVRPLLGEPTAAEEAVVASQIIEWLPGHLDTLAGVRACTDHLGICGHSRGGKVAWLVMVQNPAAARAIAGIDPVDGAGGPLGGQERVVKGSFAFNVPALVLGTGLGGACAPEGDNHVQFYAASASPAWHVVAPGQGHVDMLDEGLDRRMVRRLCPGGAETEGMRRLTAGLLVALFRGSLQGDGTAFSYLTDVAAAPIPITVESK